MRTPRIAPSLSLLLALACAGCSSNQPIVDPTTGLFRTSESVRAGGIQKRDVVDLGTFRFVYLRTQGGIPVNSEFFTRDALARIGLRHVLNREELDALIRSSPRITVQASDDTLTLYRLSQQVGAILTVDFNFFFREGASRVELSVTDASTGNTLLKVDHESSSLLATNTNGRYAVLNELKKWADDCRKRSSI